MRFGARDHDPSVGRWTAKDPIVFGGTQANLLAYSGSDPINYLDPLGLVGAFAWRSIGRDLALGPVHAGVEGIGLAGYDTVDGFFAEGILAAGGGASVRGFGGSVYRGTAGSVCSVTGSRWDNITLFDLETKVGRIELLGGGYRQDSGAWGPYWGAALKIGKWTWGAGWGLTLPTSVSARIESGYQSAKSWLGL